MQSFTSSSLQLTAMQGCEEICLSLLYFYTKCVCACAHVCVVHSEHLGDEWVLSSSPQCPPIFHFFSFSLLLVSTISFSSLFLPLSHLAFHLSVFSLLVHFHHALLFPFLPVCFIPFFRSFFSPFAFISSSVPFNANCVQFSLRFLVSASLLPNSSTPLDGCLLV